MAHAGSRVAFSGSVPRVSKQLARLRASGLVRAETLERREPTDLSGVGPSPWPDLPIEQIYGKTKALRIRQHVNPLRVEYQTPKEAPDWSAIYEDSHLPLVLDIGCAGGRFALALARSKLQHNFLGLDIRHQLIERANAWAGELGMGRRVFFEQANATISLDSMLRSYPGSLELCTIQFPDPHFKKRHKKRRIVQARLIEALANLMPSQGRVFLQSDVEEVAAAMRDEFEQFGSQHFTLSHEHEYDEDAAPQNDGTPADTPATEAEGNGEDGDALEAGEPSQLDLLWRRAGYLAENPLGVPTEREVQTLKCGDPVFRVMLVRR